MTCEQARRNLGQVVIIKAISQDASPEYDGWTGELIGVTREMDGHYQIKIKVKNVCERYKIKYPTSWENKIEGSEHYIIDHYHWDIQLLEREFDNDEND